MDDTLRSEFENWVKNGLKQLCPTMLDPRSLMCLQGERAAGSVI